MTLPLPPREEDHAKAAWNLEVTRTINALTNQSDASVTSENNANIYTGGEGISIDNNNVVAVTNPFTNADELKLDNLDSSLYAHLNEDAEFQNIASLDPTYPQYLVSNGGAGIYGWGTDVDNSYKLRDITNGQDRLIVDADGHLGVGIVPDPGASLHVSDTVDSVVKVETVGLNQAAKIELRSVDNDGGTDNGLTSFQTNSPIPDWQIRGTLTGNDLEIYTGGGKRVSINNTRTDIDNLSIGGTEITASPDEINKLDGVTASTADINKLDGLTPTTAELNFVDGATSNIQTQFNNTVTTNTNQSIAGNKTFTNRLTANDQIRVNGGSLAEPGYAFTANPASGLYQPSLNTVSLVSNGAERVRCETNGSVTLPTQPFCFLENVATQFIAAKVETTVRYGAIRANVGCIPNLPNGTISVPTAGTYMITGEFQINLENPIDLELGLFVNGNSNGANGYMNFGNVSAANRTVMYNCGANSLIEMRMRHETTGFTAGLLTQTARLTVTLLS